MSRKPVRDNETQLSPAGQRSEHWSRRRGERAQSARDESKLVGAVTDDKPVRAVRHADRHPWEHCQDAPDLVWNIMAQFDNGVAHRSLQVSVQFFLE